MNPGLGISGGNLERDLKTLLNFSNYNNSFKVFLNSIRSLSDYKKDWIYRKFDKVENLKKIKKIGILGLAYKEGTDSIKNSPSIKFLNRIKSKKYNVYLYDPLIKKIQGSSKWEFCDNDFDVLNKCELIVFGTPYKNFKKIKINIYKNLKVVIDPYGIFKRIKNKKFKYISMGS